MWLICDAAVLGGIAVLSAKKYDTPVKTVIMYVKHLLNQSYYVEILL